MCPRNGVAGPYGHIRDTAPRSGRLSCEQAGEPRLRSRDDVPAEVSELLVDALESHGCACVWLWVWGVVW
jgi:hypothetical protein